jgi:hypothetical protein
VRGQATVLPHPITALGTRGLALLQVCLNLVLLVCGWNGGVSIPVRHRTMVQVSWDGVRAVVEVL